MSGGYKLSRQAANARGAVDGLRIVGVNPFWEHPRHSYLQICEKVKNYYGVADAEAWYGAHVAMIRKTCAEDPHRLGQFESLREYWEVRQMEFKWKDGAPVAQSAPTDQGKHCVELYRVRGPGSNGEIGVLTTSHEVDEFVSGLASACAAYLKDNHGDSEHALRWILRNAMPIAFKLSGYKADQVVERHVLMCGTGEPSSDDIVASA